ncbi:Adhesion G-protein coupled receptor G1 [Varanus komodoensis]|nr:Adhesion G-protein coupled receptor G1 [Varanus komodoensis]
MLFFLSHFLFLLQGICGSGRHGEDFRFCAERMQTEKGHLRYKSQENAISIANSASELAVSAPFSPERQQNTNISESRTWPLPELPGSYRFCVYWFQHARIFMLSYGSTKNYTLSKGAAYFLNSPNISGEATEGGTRLLFNVSYAFDKGWQNKSLPSSSAYFFRFTELCKGKSAAIVASGPYLLGGGSFPGHPDLCAGLVLHGEDLLPCEEEEGTFAVRFE